MANYNLTNQTISSSFQQLLQKDTDTGNLVDGLGNPIDGITISGSVSSSFVGDGSGIDNLNPKYATTGSNTFVDNQTIQSSNLVLNTGGGLINTAKINFTGSFHDINLIASGTSFDGFGLELDGAFQATKFFGDGSGLTGIATSIDTGSFATTGSNTFTGDQNISGAVTASRLRVENNTHLDGTLRVTNDTTIDGDVRIQSATPNLKLRDTSGGGFSSGYDLRVDTGSFEIYDDTHNRDVLSDFFNTGTSKHTTSLTSEIIVISGSDSVTIQGQLTASLQEGYAWVGNSSGVIQAVATSSFGGGGTIDTGSFATTGSNEFIGDQGITGSLSVLGVSGSDNNPLDVNSGYNAGDRVSIGFFKGEFSQAEVQFVAQNSVFQSTGALNFNTRLAGGSNTLLFDSNKIIISSSTALETSTPILTVANPANTIRPGLNTQYGGAVGIFDTATNNEINLILKSEEWGYPNNWTGPSISGNNPSDEYPAFIGFQQKDNWTDGRVTVLKPLIVSGNLEMGPDTAIIARVLEATSEFATPLILVDELEPNSGTDISIASGNLVFANTGQVINNENGSVVANSIEGITEMASPLLLVDTLEPNTDSKIRIATNTEQTGSFTLQGSVNATTTGGHILEVLPTGGSGTDRGRIEVSDVGGGVSFFVAEATRTSFAATNAGAYADSLDFSYYNISGSGTSERAQFSLGPDTDNTQNIIKLKAETISLQGPVSITETMNLTAQDPLPTGAVGDLAVSGSNLYFYNGAWTQVV
jgi:hypothetical protein